MLLSLRIGYLYLIMMLVMALLFTHLLQLPSFFSAKRASTEQRLMFSLTYCRQQVLGHVFEAP